MQKHRSFFSMLLFLVLTNAIAQLGDSNNVNIPNIVPPSPETAGIAKYVDMKINEYQGMVQQSIPIYNASSGNVSVPISLNYQSGGFKVMESSNSIGLGWSLNAGGVVTRSMNGLPDNYNGNNPAADIITSFLELVKEVDYNYLYSGPQDNIRYSYLQQMSQGCADAQPDIFTFNFNGYTGKFNFDWGGNIVVNSEYDISVTPIWSNGYNTRINGWIFETPDGFTYRFTTAEQTTNMSTTGLTFCFRPTQSFNSSWHLSQITDPHDKRNVFFEYEPYLIKDHYIFTNTTREHRLSVNGACNDLFPVNSPVEKNTTNINISGRRLSRIYSDNSPVEVLFNASTKLVNSSSSSDYYALGEIQIKNRIHNSLIKKIKLSHDFSTGRLTLKSLQEFGTNDSTLPAYEFFYHDRLESRTSIKKDHWGYENKNETNKILPPYFIKSYDGITRGYGGADRSPDFEGSKSGVLYKIKYPTGGYDEYTFEQNTYGFVGSQQIDEFKSERITKYVNASGREGIPCTNPTTPPRSDYDTNTFTLTNTPGNNDPEEEIAVKISGYVRKYTYDYFSAGFSPIAEIRNSQGEIVAKISLLSDTNVDKTILLYPGEYSMLARATWKSCDNGNFDKAFMKVIYTAHFSERLYEKPTGGVRVSKIDKYDSNNTLLLSQEYSYTMENGYSSGFIHKEPEYTYPLTKFKYVNSSQPVGGADIGCDFMMALDNDVSNLGVTDGGHMGYKKVTITQINKDTQSKENGTTILNFTATPNLVYDPIPIRPSKSNSHYSGLLANSKILDKNETLLKESNNTYSYKVNSTKALKVYFKGGLVIPGDEFKFDKGRYDVNIGHSKIKTEENKTKLSGLDHVIKKEYTYDNAVQNLKQEKIHYDNNKIITNTYYYPVDLPAIQNLTPAQKSAYTNLLNNHRLSEVIHSESHLKKGNNPQSKTSSQRTLYKNWTTTITLPEISQISKGTNDLENRLRYHKYDEFGNPLVVSKENGTSIIYIWGYWNELPIAKIENATYDQISSYVSDLKTKSNADNDRTIGNSGKEGALRLALNALRNAFPNAMVTTYTYDPLIGVTSTTDSKGYTMYYQYDEFNRLEFIKDSLGKLVSENKYNYKNQ